MINNETIEKIILASKLMPKKDLTAIVAEAEAKKTSLESIVVEKGIIPEDTLINEVAKSYKVPAIKLSTLKIDKETLKTIPEVVASKNQIISFEHDAKGIKLAMADPTNKEIVDQLKKKLGVDIEVYYASEKEIGLALALYKDRSSETIKDIIPTISNASGDALKKAPITQIVQKLFEYALDNRASDIHIEPQRSQTVVRFRIDGVLHDIVILPVKLHEEIVSRIKVLSHLRTDEHQAAQDGKLQIIYGQQLGNTDEAVYLKGSGQEKSDEKSVDVRVSIAPITNGENIVMRLLSERGRKFTLTNLGLSDNDLLKVKKEIAKSWGTIISVGPTGCGKTTTLYAILKILNQREVNIATIEDPVEYDMEGVSQIQVNPKTDLTFANGLRSIVRQDPDIIMVGEIRDKETAGIAVNAAMTGHLVLTTLHANDAATTLPRLNQMDIEPYLIASTINLIVAQRIVRRTCLKCAEKFEEPFSTFEQDIAPETLAKLFKIKPKSVTLIKGRGCPECHQSGYNDRIGIFELMTITTGIEQLIMSKANASQIAEQAIKDGMTTMLEDGLLKVIAGITTLDEILRVTRE
ncbi:MAG: Type II secretion system protein E [Candidatus Berkelbacteria bacterium Athens1014_28]|uniref:Type II secretion system protein E n=1 Tax=Candidatus Berkelbacteria bacterium Athens1014_28 TaxID=2017145 RepID=A0A554LJY1_9BACT|nr:MAG: Type II secretion system protein E [Candidatus Berkelbacteria bacterium Athens1014_28]